MKYCSKCGTPAEDNQNFCLNCGSKLSAPIAQQAAAAVDTAQGQLAAQQQQTAAATQTMQEQLATQQTAAAAAAATVQAQQQAAAEAAAKAKSEAEAAAKAAAQVQAIRQGATTPSGAEAAIAQSQATAQAAVAQAQAATQQPSSVAPTFSTPMESPTTATPKKSGAGKWFAIIGFALVAVVLVIILLVNVLGSSYQTPVKKLISTMNAKSLDSDDYMASYPKMISTLYKDSLKLAKEGVTLMGKENLLKLLDSADYGASMNEMYDSYEKKVGKNLKFSYSIQDKTELDAAKLASIANTYKGLATTIKSYEDKVTKENSSTKSTLVNAGVKAKDANDFCDKVASAIMKLRKEVEGITTISAGYDLKVRITYKGDKDEDRSDQTIRVLKINGKWVFDIMDSNSMLDSSFVTELINMMMLNFN
ncbi:MAG: zinc ribbon domain-containing protein [Lachnospiraceae bacterium]|nr:zinc ribbon domain-containing protein [Lachnospiraceae bacterium]